MYYTHDLTVFGLLTNLFDIVCNVLPPPSSYLAISIQELMLAGQ
jgi:hypothetical protein